MQLYHHVSFHENAFISLPISFFFLFVSFLPFFCVIVIGPFRSNGFLFNFSSSFGCFVNNHKFRIPIHFFQLVLDCSTMLSSSVVSLVFASGVFCFMFCLLFCSWLALNLKYLLFFCLWFCLCVCFLLVREHLVMW